MKGALADFEVKQLQIMLNKPVYRLIDQRTDFFPRHDLPLLMANRDREKPHGSPLPHHRTYGSRIRRFDEVNSYRGARLGSPKSLE